MTQHDTTPTFDLTEVFPDQAEPEADTPVIVYDATVNVPDHDLASIRVVGFRGTQVYIPATGRFIDATEPGKIVLQVLGDEGETAKLTLDAHTARVVFRTISNAENAADSRDYRADKPRKDFP